MTAGCAVHRVALLCWALIGCSLLDQAPIESRTVKLKVIVKSIDDAGKAVPGVELELAKKKLGVTDASGVLSTVVEGQPGTVHSLVVKCPSGFASPDKPLDVTVTELAPSSPAPQFMARCTALVHKFVLGIRTENGADLPIMHLGKEIGRTDANGVAHVTLSLPPGETASVVLDTSTKPGLLPQNPSLVFKAGGKDELVLLEQKFTLPKKQIVAKEPSRPTPL